MTAVDEPPGLTPRERYLLVLGAVDLVVVVVLMVRDTALVRSYAELRRVRLGWPVPWLEQEQNIDPPLPGRTSLLSIWEHPLRGLSFLGLAADLLLVGLVLAVAWRLLRAVVSRLRRR